MYEYILPCCTDQNKYKYKYHSMLILQKIRHYQCPKSMKEWMFMAAISI